MKTFTTLLIMILFTGITITVSAQSSNGPFEDLVGKEIESNNIFLLWQQDEGQGDGMQSFQKIYSFDGTPEHQDDRILEATQRKIDGRKVRGDQKMTVTKGRFAESPYDYIVAAWEGENRTIELSIPHFDTTDVMWNTRSAFTVSGPVASQSFSDGRMLIEAGDLNGNGLDEFVLVYEGADNYIHMEVYDTDESLMPVLRASNSDFKVEINDVFFHNRSTFPDFKATPFSLTTGDLNGNGRAEIILATFTDLAEVHLIVYEFVDGNTLIMHEPFSVGDVPFNYSNTLFRNDIQMELQFVLKAGRFRNRSTDDVAFMWTYSQITESSSNWQPPTYTYNIDSDIFLYQSSGELGQFEKSNNQIDFDLSWHGSLNSHGFHGLIDMVKGDLTGDGLDDIAVSLQGKQQAFSITNLLDYNILIERNQDPWYQAPSYNYLAIADVNQNGRGELIVTTIHSQPWVSENEGFSTRILGINDNGDDEVYGRIVVDEPVGSGEGNRRYAIAAGNFNGHNFRLGEPVYSVATDIVQPLVILNAPPVHFDIFGGVSYDINRCYSGISCDSFMASYTETAVESFGFSLEVKSDWGVSAGVGASGSISGEPLGVGASVNYETYLDGSYGRNFSNTDTETHSTSISVTIGAVEDDQIFATVKDYEIWEYPAFHGNETEPRFHIIAMKPRDVEQRWFPSKSWSANTYIPNHEVGNILSYPAYPELTHNPNLHEPIIANYEFNTYTISANSNVNWKVTIEEFEESEAATSRTIGVDYKNHTSALRLSGYYNDTQSSTHTTTVQEGIEIEIQLGGIDMSFGENRYYVTPYSYWANNGALVVDYAVRPEVSGPGGISTWWDEHYGQLPDPAFILPWRYDPEKGFGISEEAKRHQTQDIFFDFNDPEPGDTLTVTARVRNFSLVDSPPVTVHFYMGDPDDGGTPITSLDGETSFITEAGIPAQRFSDVEIEWQVPNGIGQFPRIYAVLNQDPTYEEIHTNNNKGFNILGQTSVPTSSEEIAEISLPGSFKLHQSYPNPFNPTTNIGYDLPLNTHVRLEVFNILGQRVAVLVNETQTAGFHEVRFDASHLSSGVYLYRLTTAQSVQTNKMILVK